MTQQALHQVVHWLRGVGGGPGPQSDAELLETYSASRDEAAFAELLRRHGPLVWHVCRRLLRQEQDAEDAFQATFLVLARSAASIRTRQAVASWLFGVARRTALLVRARRDRRPEHEPCLRTEPDPAVTVGSTELCEVILNALRQLPEKYRLPLLLCGVQGATKTEAAQQLGWKEGTLSGRLARARRMLEQRLLRRGIFVPSATALTATAVPRPLLAATLQAVNPFTASGSSAAVSLPATLAREVLRSMQPTCCRFVLVIVFGLIVAAAGLAYHGLAQEAPTDNLEPAAVPAPPAAEGSSPRWQERLRLLGFAGSAYYAFSPDGRLLAVVDGKLVLQFLDTTTWQPRARCDLKKFPVGTLFEVPHPFSPDGRLFVVWRRVPGKGPGGTRLIETSVIDVATGKEVATLPGTEPQFCPTGKLLATSLDDTLTLWDTATLKEVRKLAAGAEIKMLGARWSPNGRRVFAPTANGHGKLWDVANGKEIATLEGFQPVWSPDGRTLATKLPGAAIKLYDTATGKERATLTGFNQPFAQGEFSPDGRLFLSNVFETGLKADGEYDWPSQPQVGTPETKPLDVRLWDVATGKERARLPGEIRFCRGAVFSPDGRTIAYLRLAAGASDQHEAVLWDVATGKETRVLQNELGVENISFTPNGKALLGCLGQHGDEALQLWDAADGHVLPAIAGAKGGLVKFAPDRKTFVLTVMIPVTSSDLPPGGVPTPMELRIFHWSGKPLTLETRGKPVEIKGPKPAEDKKAGPGLAPAKP